MIEPLQIVLATASALQRHNTTAAVSQVIQPTFVHFNSNADGAKALLLVTLLLFTLTRGCTRKIRDIRKYHENQRRNPAQNRLEQFV